MKRDDEFNDEPEEIIDEEELVLLREMKDLKKSYRDAFATLRTAKEDNHSAQQQIDLLKEQLLVMFENWYANTFEVNSATQGLTVNFDGDHHAGEDAAHVGSSHGLDDE
jgi:meiotically up-regulated gene 157 (Mug157) protein